MEARRDGAAQIQFQAALVDIARIEPRDAGQMFAAEEAGVRRRRRQRPRSQMLNSSFICYRSRRSTFNPYRFLRHRQGWFDRH